MLHVTVRGRVQGVGFRWFVREQARELRITGWVRNHVDGSVEVLAHGDSSALQQLRSALQEGPPGSRVTEVVEEINEPTAAAMDPFGVLR